MIRVDAYPNSEATAVSVADAVKARITLLKTLGYLDPIDLARDS